MNTRSSKRNDTAAYQKTSTSSTTTSKQNTTTSYQKTPTVSSTSSQKTPSSMGYQKTPSSMGYQKTTSSMGYQKTPSLMNNTYKKNSVVGVSKSFGGSSGLPSNVNQTNSTVGRFGRDKGYGGSKSVGYIGGSGGNDKPKTITPISEVDPMLNAITIQGRCISIWHSHRMNAAHDPYSLDLVLQDVHNTRIQVYIKKEFMFRFEPLFEEGQCYLLSNFGIIENSGRLPLLPHIYKISLYKSTIVTRIEPFDNNRNGFILEPFKHLLDHEHHQYYETDVVDDMVDMINERMMAMLEGEEKIYESSDSVSLVDDDTNFDDSIYTTDFLNGIKMSSLPKHAIKLKVGTPIMLMRNIDQKAGLCNGTRLQVIRMGINVIEGRIISGGSVGKACAIPRMIITPTDTKMPFKLNMRQFPIQVCFGMTINKSQCQTLSQVGLFLPKPVFSHGQLYVALSRVKSKKGLKVLCLGKDENYTNKTTNVVYKEVLYRI